MQIWFDAACKRVQEEESEEKGRHMCCDPGWKLDGWLLRPWRLFVVSLPSVVLLSVRCLVAVVALTVSVFSVHFSWVLMLRVLQLLILVCPCRLAFCVFFCFQCIRNVAMPAKAGGLLGHVSCLSARSEVPDGFSGRWLRRHVGMGSEVPMDSLGEGSVAAFPKSLMDSMEDGSVVTWKMRTEFPLCGRVMYQCPFSHPQR